MSKKQSKDPDIKKSTKPEKLPEETTKNISPGANPLPEEGFDETQMDSEKKVNKDIEPNDPTKLDTTGEPEKNNDPTRIRPGVNDPKKNDATRIPGPRKPI